jgi:DNA-binding LytR/AlgR family response regulator
MEAFGSYIKVHTDTETILTLDRLVQYEKKLPESNFIRIHKSYIINIRKVKEIETTRILIGNQKLTIGATYRQAFKDYIKRV